MSDHNDSPEKLKSPLGAPIERRIPYAGRVALLDLSSEPVVVTEVLDTQPYADDGAVLVVDESGDVKLVYPDAPVDLSHLRSDADAHANGDQILEPEKYSRLIEIVSTITRLKADLDGYDFLLTEEPDVDPAVAKLSDDQKRLRETARLALYRLIGDVNGFINTLGAEEAEEVRGMRSFSLIQSFLEHIDPAHIDRLSRHFIGGKTSEISTSGELPHFVSKKVKKHPNEFSREATGQIVVVYDDQGKLMISKSNT